MATNDDNEKREKRKGGKLTNKVGTNLEYRFYKIDITSLRFQSSKLEQKITHNNELWSSPVFVREGSLVSMYYQVCPIKFVSQMFMNMML